MADDPDDGCRAELQDVLAKAMGGDADAAAELAGRMAGPLEFGAVGRLGPVAGIQITASHNPPADNGYKLYDATGGQIVPPSDGEIERAIEAAPGAVGVPRAPGAEVTDLLDRYLDEVAALPLGQE